MFTTSKIEEICVKLLENVYCNLLCSAVVNDIYYFTFASFFYLTFYGPDKDPKAGLFCF